VRTADTQAAARSGELILLRAGDATLTIDPNAGARFASLTVDGHELLVPEAASPIDWGCYPMAPFAGRIRDGRFTFRGQSYQLETAMPPHAIHGTVLDRAWTVLEAGDDHAAFEIDLGAGWPFRGGVRQSIELGPTGLRAALVLDADEPMPAWLGWHPWFRRRVGAGGSLELEFAAGHMYERGDDGLPTGRRIDPTTRPWDDAFTDVAHPPRLRWPGLLTLEIDSLAPVWVVYDERPGAVCVEPQSAPPDAIGLAQIAGEEPPTAEPGRPMMIEMTWRWERDPAG